MKRMWNEGIRQNIGCIAVIPPNSLTLDDARPRSDTVKYTNRAESPVNRTEFTRQFNYFVVQITTFRTVQNQRVTSGA